MTPGESEKFWREHGPLMQPPDGEGVTIDEVAGDLCFGLRVDEETLAEDLARASKAATAAVEPAIRDLEAEGSSSRQRVRDRPSSAQRLTQDPPTRSPTISAMLIDGAPLDHPAEALDDLLRVGLEAPDDLALVSADRSLTWGELEGESTRLAGGYLGLGLEPGDRVASLMPNRIDLVVHYLACFKAGLIVTPLNSATPFARSTMRSR
ncbi:MAG TPA: AMP-binding protein [Solirubrobacterales bacterium]|nr:AMP-binding protein [Solirubrobacterales bacterium]